MLKMQDGKKKKNFLLKKQERKVESFRCWKKIKIKIHKQEPKKFLSSNEIKMEKYEI